jgi:SAM-dependent methyltransferase
VLDRASLIALCKGKGVELGPGLNPQIQPSAQVDVTYVEQASPEQWETLYNEQRRLNVDRSLWDRYVLGNAFPLPVADESLDFVFASHVFEHLANPLGHLRHWYGKLRKGGIVALVIPDFAGCKDYVFEPTSMAEIEEEFVAGVMNPERRHFERWAAVRAPSQDPDRFRELNRSIHVHFYSCGNMSSLLELACEKLGFEGYEVRHVPNHKDFHAVLRK